jgi:hypothetical protein
MKASGVGRDQGAVSAIGEPFHDFRKGEANWPSGIPYTVVPARIGPVVLSLSGRCAKPVHGPLLRVSKYEMKSAEKTGSSWSVAIIADFSRRTTEHSVTATAVEMRSG